MKTKKEKIEAILEAAKGNLKPLRSGTLPKFLVLMQEEDGLYYDTGPEKKTYTETDLERLKKELEDHHPESKLIIIIGPKVKD